MITVVQVLAVLALAANAVVYGTDAAAALVVRSANTHLDDTAMTLSAGWGHYYADRRMPPVGITGQVSMLAAAVGPPARWRPVAGGRPPRGGAQRLRRACTPPGLCPRAPGPGGRSSDPTRH
ncbi:hypothetical protein [Nocardia farcinica]|uniref:hypothetical protein n=1 Tax=Nocardia farcinica TaxID=37329 RepID=UPI0024540F67|nr:hypothetical protein [Nocardia farcinica]